VSKGEDIILKDYLQKSIKEGIIRPSKSHFSSPVLFVNKANEEKRIARITEH
jgi:hypothetical protein